MLAVIGGLAGAECVWAIVARSFAAESFGLTGRLQGTLGNANSLAMLGAVATIAGLALASRARGAGLALASLGAFTAFATSSRAAAAATLVAAVVLALATDGRPLRRLAVPAALLPAIALGTWASSFAVFDEVAGVIQPAGAGLLAAGDRRDGGRADRAAPVRRRPRRGCRPPGAPGPSARWSAPARRRCWCWWP